VGLAVEDLAAARLILESARRSGAGTFVEFGGGRDDFERAP
jgi:ornithine cyclodeaminase/alanine dehydrogenase-like protein (mu-crystallin family)